MLGPTHDTSDTRQAVVLLEKAQAAVSVLELMLTLMRMLMLFQPDRGKL